MTTKIEIDREGGTAIIRLANETKLNALAGDFLRALPGHLDRWAADPSASAAIVTGSRTRAFCAGAGY